MNIKNRRFLIILALFLLAVMFFGVIMHESNSHDLHGSVGNNVFCSMCILGKHAFKTLIPMIAGIVLTITSLKAVTRNEKATVFSKTRNFPLLC